MKGLAGKATLLKNLLFAKMNEGKSMPKQLNNFFNTVDKLHKIELNVADDLLSI